MPRRSPVSMVNPKRVAFDARAREIADLEERVEDLRIVQHNRTPGSRRWQQTTDQLLVTREQLERMIRAQHPKRRR